MPLPGSPANALPADDAALMRRIEGIERQLRELGPSVAGSILPMIASLQAQADATDAVVVALADVIDAQVTGSTHTASAGPTPAVAGSDFAPVTVTVPTGYTKAIVTATSSILAGGGPPNMTASANIAGNLGFAMYIANLAGTEASGTPTHAASLTGLSGGGTFTVATRVVTKTAATNLTYFTTTATVIFLR